MAGIVQSVRAGSESKSTRIVGKCCQDILQLSLLVVALSAAFRIVLLIISNMLVHSPAVLVLLSQLSSFLMILVLGIQTTQWGKIGLFPMNKQGQARVGFSSKCAAGLFFVGTILFPTLILTSDDFLQKKTFARRGSEVMGVLTVSFSLVLFFLGCNLSRNLSRVKTRQSQNKSSKRSFESRLAWMVILFTICLLAQGLGSIFVVQDRYVGTELFDLVVFFVFYGGDLLSAFSLLYLLAIGVEGRRDRRTKKRSEQSSIEMKRV